MTTSYSSVRVGDLAPDFTLPSDDGSPLTLSSLRGRRVVLFFYPKDSSAGCSLEATEFAAEHARLRRAKVEVLGVSVGSVKAKAKFKSAKRLPYSLLADEQALVAQAYGVWREKVLFGHRYLGILRTTYAIGADGRVEAVWEDVEYRGHAVQVSAALRGVAAPRAAARSRQAAKKK